MLRSLEQAQAGAVDSLEMVARTLQTGADSLRMQMNDAPTPHDVWEVERRGAERRAV